MSRVSPFRHHWHLDPDVAFLNHGSFGACPVSILEKQNELRLRMERQPVQFFVRELEEMLDEARASLARFLKCPTETIAWVRNATEGVNAVLRSMELSEGDELLTTDHEYNACRNTLDFVAERTGAKVVIAAVPYPVESEDEVVETILACVTDKTRLALIDHITSQTGLILPIERIVSALDERGVETLVDGAHGPGMLDLDVPAVGAAYYAGNCHKWTCSPKGAGFLYVRPDLQAGVRPVCISHAAGFDRATRSKFLMEFDWTGTFDPTAILCVPDCIEFMGTLLHGGWAELRERNRSMTLHAQRALNGALGTQHVCPESMVGSLATVPLPDSNAPPPTSPLYADPLQDILLGEYGIEVPIVPWPSHPKRLVRVSAQIYNDPSEYERLADALRKHAAV